jgi:hypothetical protein
MPSTTSRGAFPYPLGSDAPATLGVNTAIQNLANQNASINALDLQGTHAARPAAATANQGTYYWETDTGHLFRSNGSAWILVDGIPSYIGNVFPTSPFLGQRVIVQSPQGLSGHTNLEFTYDSTIADVYKWTYSGGPCLSYVEASAQTFVADGSGPDITLTPVFNAPWAGYYQIAWGAKITLPAASSLGAITTNGTIHLLQGSGPAIIASSPSFLQPINGSGQTFAFASFDEVLMTASQVLRLGSTASSASGVSTYTLTHVFIYVTPVRVSP